MEVGVCLACGVLVGAGTLFALREETTPAARGALVRVAALRHALMRGLSACASTSLGAWLAGWPAMAQLACEMQPRLVASGMQMEPAEVGVAIVACMLLVSFCIGFLCGSLVLGVVAFLCCLATAQLRFLSAQKQRATELGRQMPGVLRTLATALESGNTLVQAIEYVSVHERGQAGEAFARASLRLRCGEAVETALRALEDELGAPGVSLMTTALSISQRTGSPLRELLQNAAGLVEQQGEFERLLAVRTAQARLSVRVVCGLPPLMVLLLSVVSPDYRAGVTSGGGMACLVVAVCMDGAALLAIRTIIGGVL